MKVVVDTSKLARAVIRLERGIDQGAPVAAQRTATTVATDLRARVPVRTGRLRASVRTERTADGAQVIYGAGLPYATYIERRTGAVDAATSGADRDFQRACQTVAATEVRAL